MSTERVLRDYFRAKDENRPHLLDRVFSSDAQVEICNRSDQISFPAITAGLEEIADVLVRRFNQKYENIYSFYLNRPGPDDETFSCDWLVGMTEKESRCVRVGCGTYAWTFQRSPARLAARLVITIEAMLLLDASRASNVFGCLTELEYPWTSAAKVLQVLPPAELDVVRDYLGREIGQASS